jgi:hypothetical protein
MRNNIKIKFNKPVYVVDEKNKVVICTLKYKVDAPSTVVFASHVNINGNLRHITQNVKAIARAKDNDTFDVNVGKKVSLAKAENLAYSYVNEWAKTAKNELISAVSAIIDFSNKTKKVRDHNVVYMRKF